MPSRWAKGQARRSERVLRWFCAFDATLASSGQCFHDGEAQGKMKGTRWWFENNEQMQRKWSVGDVRPWRELLS